MVYIDRDADVSRSVSRGEGKENVGQQMRCLIKTSSLKHIVKHIVKAKVSKIRYANVCEGSKHMYHIVWTLVIGDRFGWYGTWV